MKKILVTGGTGTLGQVVVGLLRDRGHEVLVASRRSPSLPIDLRTGAGIDAAVDGVDTVVHCASTPTGGDVGAARHLVEAARRAGVRHLVYISIVGVDRVPLRYYRAKLAVERLIEQSGLGWTILRTTQFHDLLLRLFSAKLPVLAAPSVPVQPVDVREVAARLVELALGEPAGRVPDLGGPQVRDVVDLARAYRRVRGDKRPVLPFRLPGKIFRAYRRGGHLAPEHADGKTGFEEYLTGE